MKATFLVLKTLLCTYARIWRLCVTHCKICTIVASAAGKLWQGWNCSFEHSASFQLKTHVATIFPPHQKHPRQCLWTNRCKLGISSRYWMFVSPLSEDHHLHQSNSPPDAQNIIAASLQCWITSSGMHLVTQLSQAVCAHKFAHKLGTDIISILSFVGEKTLCKLLSASHGQSHSVCACKRHWSVPCLCLCIFRNNHLNLPGAARFSKWAACKSLSTRSNPFSYVLQVDGLNGQKRLKCIQCWFECMTRSPATFDASASQIPCTIR